jgi:hypothetical protein
MAASVSGRLVLSLVLSCVLRSVHAQGIVGDSALIDEAAKMEPGQSMVRGDTKLTLNQREAGTKDANGWFLAQSAKGAFSVRFPGPINDETIVTKDRGSRIEMNMLTARTPTTNFMVFCTKQSGHDFSMDEARRIVAAIGGAAKDFKSQPFASGPISGLEYNGVDRTGTNFAGRMFLLNKQLCQFLIGSHVHTEGIAPEARTALDSFQPVS